jgi:hypothetical protein
MQNFSAPGMLAGFALISLALSGCTSTPAGPDAAGPATRNSSGSA